MADRRLYCVLCSICLSTSSGLLSRAPACTPLLGHLPNKCLNRERYVQGGSRKVVTARLATREDLPVLLPLIEAAIAELQKGFLDEGADRGEPRRAR